MTLGPNRRQAITCTNNDSIHQHDICTTRFQWVKKIISKNWRIFARIIQSYMIELEYVRKGRNSKPSDGYRKDIDGSVLETTLVRELHRFGIHSLSPHRCGCNFDYDFQLNTLRPRQNGCHFTDDIFKCIFLNENVWIPIKISMKFVPKGPINNIPALVQIMARRRPGDKPLSEPMIVSLTTYICVTRPQWVKSKGYLDKFQLGNAL